MKQITILSDTHGYIDQAILNHIANCDEVWHIGDFGSIEVYDKIANVKPIKAVYGNIDNHELKTVCPEINIFQCENVKVLMRHICGYPGRYEKIVKELILKEKPNLVVAGHSHILKVIYDKHFNHLHINPGAAGNNGFHHVRTLIHLKIDGSDMKDLKVVELGPRSYYSSSLSEG